MPHECVSCGEVFDDGADEVFEGCPVCGATKFFYVKEVTEENQTETGGGAEIVESGHETGEETGTGTTLGEPENPTETPSDGTAAETRARPETQTQTPTQARKGSDGTDDIVEAKSEYDESFGGTIGPEAEDEGTKATDGDSGSSPVTTDDSGRKFRRARPDEARRRLLDEFETVRIVEPGSYELNLMNLYEEEEKIIALQEDGKYQVSIPSGFGED